MLRNLWRFRTSLLPGLGVAVGLLGFGIVLFWTLIDAGGTSSSIIDARIWGLLRFTLYQASLSTLLSLLVGLLLAWSLIHRPVFRGRSLLVALFASSLVLPSLIVAFGILSVLGNHGWLNRLTEAWIGHPFGNGIYGIWGIIIAHVYLNASFAAIGLLRALETIPMEKYRLAKSLGLSTWRRFVLIEWVAIRSTMVSMGATIFLLCFSSFAIVLLLGGNPSYNTLEVAIYEAVRIDFDIPYALKIAWIQLSISTLLIILASFKGAATLHLSSGRRSDMLGDGGLWYRLQNGIILVGAVAYILPLIAILIDGIGADFYALFSRPLFWRSVVMSLGIAAVSAGVTLVFTIALSDAKRHFGLHGKMGNRRMGRVIGTLVSLSGHLYLAVPSLMLGLGFFLMARRWGGDMMIWGIVAIVVANTLMSLPFALSIMMPAMVKTARRYDRLVLSLGLNAWQRWRHAEWPHLRRSIGYVGALSFSLSLGDLGVIALFGNREITTLPWYLYQLMGSYRTSDAAGVALVLLLLVVGIFFVVHFEPYKERSRVEH